LLNPLSTDDERGIIPSNEGVGEVPEQLSQTNSQTKKKKTKYLMFYLLALSFFHKKLLLSLPLIPTGVEQPMRDHLSAQGRPDPRGGLHCFWSPNKT
jgi:hypothetical protein